MPSTNLGRQATFDVCADAMLGARERLQPSCEAPRSGMVRDTSDKPAYILPRVEHAVTTDNPPPDVIAEWSGQPPKNPTPAITMDDSPFLESRFHTNLNWNKPEQRSIRSLFWKRQNDVLEYFMDRDALLFHPEMKLLCQLNETAYFIWRNCDGRSIEHIARMLTEAFNVEINKATDHAMKIMELFSISGFVVEESLHEFPSA